MAFPQEINLRSTTGLRSDDSSDAHVQTVTTNDFPDVSAQGNNVGWESGTREGAVNSHNAASGVDVRIAGNHYEDTDDDVYRIDLPATGAYNISIAMGDCDFGADNNTLTIFDTTTSRGVLINGVNVSAHNFVDAQGTTYSDANWPGSQTAEEITFTTTICRFHCDANGGFWGLAHIGISSALSREQHAVRAFDDDGSEDASTALAAEDTATTTGKDDKVQGRIGVQYVNDPPAEAMQWEYTEDGDDDWRKVT